MKKRDRRKKNVPAPPARARPQFAYSSSAREKRALDRSMGQRKLVQGPEALPVPQKNEVPEVYERSGVDSSRFSLACLHAGCTGYVDFTNSYCRVCSRPYKSWSMGRRLKQKKKKKSQILRSSRMVDPICSKSFPKASPYEMSFRCIFISTLKSRGGARLGPSVCPDKYHVEGNLCSICLKSVQNVKSIFQLPCKHVFHFSCIDKWSYISTTCPLCRRAFWYEF